MLRVVLDTNVVVSSLLSGSGPPARVVDAWRGMKYALLVSPAIVAEIRATLSYPRIKDKYAISDEVVDQLARLLLRDAIVVRGKAKVAGSIPEDPKDEMFLACAVEGEADLIVSGDQHLLRLGAYEGIPIVTARQFLERLGID